MINRKEVLEKYNGHCAYCGKEITLKEMQVDHKHPYIDGLKERIEELEAAGTILRDCFSLHKPNWLIDKDAIKEWDELTKKECE